MFCTISYRLYYLNYMKNTHRGLILLVLKVSLLHGCFSGFLNCTNGTKPRKASHKENGKQQKPTNINMGE